MDTNQTNNPTPSGSKVTMATVLMLAVGVVGGMFLTGNFTSQKASLGDAVINDDSSSMVAIVSDIPVGSWTVDRTNN